MISGHCLPCCCSCELSWVGFLAVSSWEAGGVSSVALHTSWSPTQAGMPRAGATLPRLVTGIVTRTCLAGEQSRYSPRPGWVSCVGALCHSTGTAQHTGPQFLPRHQEGQAPLSNQAHQDLN